METEYDPSEQYPLCVAMGEDGNEFRESELRDMVAGWCNQTLKPPMQVRQIEIYKKLQRGEELTVDDVNDCKMLRDLPGEEWRVIPEWEHYKVSNLGRVRNCGVSYIDKMGRTVIIHEKIMALSNTKKGYCSVTLSYRFCRLAPVVYRLVAEAFIPKTEEDIRLGRTWINHIDANKHNNRVENLEWCTAFENNMHARNLGLYTREIVDHDMALAMRLDYLNGLSVIDIAKKYGIGHASVGNALFLTDWRWPDLPKITERHRKDQSGINSSGSKFTLEDVLEIKLRILHGESNSMLSKRFNVHISTIFDIRKGYSYKKIKLEDYPEEVTMLKRKLGYDK